VSKNKGVGGEAGMVYRCRTSKSGKSGGIQYVVHAQRCSYYGRDVLHMSNLVRRFGTDGIAEMVASGKIVGCRSCKPDILSFRAAPPKNADYRPAGRSFASGGLPADHHGRKVIGMVFCRSKVPGSLLPRSASNSLFPCEVISVISGDSPARTLYIANVWDENAVREPLVIRGTDVVKYEKYGVYRPGISDRKVSA